jgi:hypothetical protein
VSLVQSLVGTRTPAGANMESLGSRG